MTPCRENGRPRLPCASAVYGHASAARASRRPAALSSDGASRPILAPHEDSLSRHMLDGVSLLPRDALRNDGNVLVVDADDRLQFRPVRVLNL